MKRSAAVLAATVVVVTVLFWAGWHNLRARRLAIQQAEENHVTLTPASPAPAGSAAGETPGPAGLNLRGKPAPAFSLQTIDGKKVSLSDYKGRPVVVNFWATWCGPCKVEMPWFEEFRKQYAAQGFEVLGLTVVYDSKDEVAKGAKKVGVTYPILLAGDPESNAYGLGDYLPVSFYVDGKGVVVEQTMGLGSKEQVEADIKKTIAGGI